MHYEEETASGGLSLKVWFRLFKYFKPIKKQVASAMVVIVLTTAIVAAFPLFTRYAVNSFVVPETINGLIPFTAVYFVFILLAGTGSYFWVKLLIDIEMNISRIIRRDCFVHLQKLPISYHNVNSVGYLIGRVMSDTERIS